MSITGFTREFVAEGNVEIGIDLGILNDHSFKNMYFQIKLEDFSYVNMGTVDSIGSYNSGDSLENDETFFIIFDKENINIAMTLMNDLQGMHEYINDNIIENRLIHIDSGYIGNTHSDFLVELTLRAYVVMCLRSGIGTIINNVFTHDSFSVFIKDGTVWGTSTDGDDVNVRLFEM